MRPPSPTTLDECDRLADCLVATALEAHRRADDAHRRARDAERVARSVRTHVEAHRALRALPSDALIAELVTAQDVALSALAAATYAHNWTENDAIIYARLRRVVAPTWWERLRDWWSTP